MKRLNLRKDGIRIGRYKIHRKDQWDIGQSWTTPAKPDVIPLLCVHRQSKDRNRTTRVFCVWFWGLQIGSFWLSPKTVRRWYRSFVGRITKLRYSV